MHYIKSHLFWTVLLRALYDRTDRRGTHTNLTLIFQNHMQVDDKLKTRCVRHGLTCQACLRHIQLNVTCPTSRIRRVEC